MKQPLLSLDEATKLYCTLHQQRVQKLIDNCKDETHRKYLTEKELPYWSSDSIKRKFSDYYHELLYDKPAHMATYCLSLNKIYWRVIAACTGHSMPKNESDTRTITVSWYGREVIEKFFNDQKEKAQAESEANRITKERKQKEEFILDINRFTINGVTVKTFVDNHYRDGYRLLPHKQGFSTRLRMEKHNADGTFRFYPNPTQKKHGADQKSIWDNFVIPYMKQIQDLDEHAHSVSESSEAIDPEIERLFHPPTPTPPTPTPPTNELENIIAFPTPKNPTITDRFPLLKKFQSSLT